MNKLIHGMYPADRGGAIQAATKLYFSLNLIGLIYGTREGLQPLKTQNRKRLLCLQVMEQVEKL